MSKSSTNKRILLAGILIGGKYAFSRWKYVARLMSYNEDSAVVWDSVFCSLTINILIYFFLFSVSKYFGGWRPD